MEVIENRVGIGQVALDRERPAGHNDHNDRFAGAFYGFEQVRLFAYQVDVAQRVSLSRQDSLFADKDNNHIGLAGDAFCSFEITGALVSRMTQPGLVVVFYVFVFVALQGFQRSYGVVFVAVERPCAQLVVGCVSHRADNGYGHILFQRKHTVVLQ